MAITVIGPTCLDHARVAKNNLGFGPVNSWLAELAASRQPITWLDTNQPGTRAIHKAGCHTHAEKESIP
jgi:hypothetical protein